MAKIEIQPDCGNSPRKGFLKELYVALANADIEFLKTNIPVNISWEVIGQKLITGKDEYLKAITGHKVWQPKQLTIETIITHGPDASVNGEIRTKDNLSYSFCDVFKFKGAGGTTINSIKSFVIEQRLPGKQINKV